MRNERGITLVALILIIVVLVILAGISISLVVSNEADRIVIEPENYTSLNNFIEDFPDKIDMPDTNEDVYDVDIDSENVGGASEDTNAPETDNTVNPDDTTANDNVSAISE